MITILMLGAMVAQAGQGQPNETESANGRPPAGPASAPSSMPAEPLPPGTGADMTGEVTFIYEVDEQRFKVQESWTLQNDAQKLVTGVTFPMPTGTFRLTLDEDIRNFAANEVGTSYGSTGPLGPGQHNVAAAYFLGFSGNRATIRRTIPVNMVSARLIVDDYSGMSLSSNVGVRCEPRDLNGLKFKVCTFDRVAAGDVFEVRFAGLPTRSTWPRLAALLLSLGFVGWMVVALTRTTIATSTLSASPVSAQARRDQIVRALELLQEDRQAEKITDKKFERRRRELMDQLAAVLREIELAQSAR